MADVKNILEIVDCGIATEKLIAGLADGVDLSDLPLALAAARSVQPAIEDAQLAIQEYVNMDDAAAKVVEDRFAGVEGDKKELVKACIHVFFEGRKIAAALKLKA